ncbi:DHA1 family inner membrane transport protein [Rhodococcus sp. LBL1]|nr:DHA1 family inner membrane transport protein [Rhodococcus sp. LBL1]MDH6685462.1 DHA1 family inner membrane transport protein [Rhodococcus sp. LBL2]
MTTNDHTGAPAGVRDDDLDTGAHRNRSPWALLTLAISAFAIGTTEFITNGLILTLAHEFDVSVATTGLLTTGYAAGIVVGGPLLAAATLRTPRKRLLALLLTVFLLGNVICALAPTFTVLMAGRFVSAVSHGAYFGVASVVAASLVAPTRRAAAIAFVFTGLTLANVLGMPLGTVVGQNFGWRESFALVVILGLVGLAGTIALVPPNNTTPAIPLHDELRPFRSWKLWVALATTAIGFGGLFSSFTYIAPLLTDVTGFRDSSLPWLLMIYGAGLVVGNWAGGRAADRHPDITVAVLLLILVTALTAQGVLATNQAATVALLFVVGAAGFGLIPPLQNRVLSISGQAATLVSTANIAAFNLGATLGSLLGATTLQTGLGYTAPSYAGAAMCTLGLILFAASTLRGARA